MNNIMQQFFNPLTQAMWKCRECLLKGKKKKQSVMFSANVQHMVTRKKCDS